MKNQIERNSYPLAALRFWAFALLAFVLSARIACAQSGGVSPDNAPPLLPEFKVSLRFLQEKVAAGNYDTPAHKAQFEVLVTDAVGKPKPDARVPLPVVVRGGQGGFKGKITACVEWLGQPLADGGILTDAKGLARGTFTSGNCTETTVLQMPGRKNADAKAAIEQVWTEMSYGERWQDDANNDFRKVFKMFFVPGVHGNQGKEQWEPITGHRAQLKLETLKISIWYTDRGPDEDGDGQSDGMSEIKAVSSDDADLAAWNYYSRFVSVAPIVEIEPGCYAVEVAFNIPKNAEGEDEFTIDHWSYTIQEEQVFDSEGASGQ